MHVLLGCLTRSVSPVTAYMTGAKKGGGRKVAKGKKEEEVPLARIAEVRKEAKGFSYLPTPPFSLPPLPFSTPATQATGYGHGTK